MMTNFRSNFGRLALELIAEGDSVRALAALEKCMEIMPNERIPFGYFMVPVIEAYYQLGEIEKANRYLEILSDSNEEELRYFLSLDPKFRDETSYEKQLRMHIIQETVRLTSEYQQDGQFQIQKKKFDELVVLYQINS
jgi:tetratricopeptide (TPR) repeat protein